MKTHTLNPLCLNPDTPDFRIGRICRYFVISVLAIFALTACEEKKKPDGSETANAQTQAPETADEKQLAHSVEFNGKKIPMNVFYCYGMIDEYTEGKLVSKLVFEYDGKKQEIITKGETFFNPSVINVDDYNFDNYMDIAIASATGTRGLANIYIYNPQKKEYYYQAELSKMNSIFANKETQTIEKLPSGASMDYESSEYKWVKGELTLVKSEKQEHDEGLDKYIRTVRTLEKGKWVEKRDTVNSDGSTAKAESGSGTFTDSRDKKTYKTVKIGSQTWLAENLNYEAKGSLCYGNKKEFCDKYGRLYDWNTAKAACPSGWHLPSKDEWQVLADVVGGNGEAGKKLKAKSGWNDYEGKSGNGTDIYGFSALPGGHYRSGGFWSVGEGGDWWSTSEGSIDYAAYYRNMYYEVGYLHDYDGDKNHLRSVRCLKD
jgi:uncharacterized protein (TIGR02145 family)